MFPGALPPRDALGVRLRAADRIEEVRLVLLLLGGSETPSRACWKVGSSEPSSKHVVHPVCSRKKSLKSGQVSVWPWERRSPSPGRREWAAASSAQVGARSVLLTGSTSKYSDCLYKMLQLDDKAKANPKRLDDLPCQQCFWLPPQSMRSNQHPPSPPPVFFSGIPRQAPIPGTDQTHTFGVLPTL